MDNAICVTRQAVMFVMTAIMNQAYKQTRVYIFVTTVRFFGKTIQNHRPQQLKSSGTGNDFDTGKLQLLSVLCIETSHYVCFTRVNENDWVFFDSMAERLGTYVYYIVACKFTPVFL